MRCLLGLLIASVACVPPEIELEGKPCPCPSGYSCDDASNTCVREGTAGAAGPGAGGSGSGTNTNGGGGSGAMSNGGGSPDCITSCGPECPPCCPTCPVLPAPVALDTFAIDVHEVRRVDYQEFLDAAVDLSTQSAVCSWNASFNPQETLPITDTQPCSNYTFDTQVDRPIACVDWCDAQAYCAWRGMRLCGKRGGGTLMKVPEDLNDATKSEWFAACSNDGQQAFPYGDTEDPSRCNTQGGAPGSEPLEVTSFDECEGGLAGLFDMVGNVEEWESSCEPFGPDENHQCSMRGGAFWCDAVEPQPYSQCATTGRSTNRNRGNASLSFRCCSDLR